MMAFYANKAIFVFIASCCLAQHAASQEAAREKRQATAPEQPRIVTTDGHLIFQTGANHNISFKSSSGGSVNIDGTNIKQMSEKVTDNEAKLALLNGVEIEVDVNKAEFNNFTNIVNHRLSNVDSQLRNATRQINEQKTQISALDDIQNVVAGNKAEFDVYKVTVNGRFGTVNSQIANTTRQVTTLTSSTATISDRVRRVQNNLNTVTRKLVFDNCGSGPCHNGGTCVDMYDTYRCLCPVNWQGTTCNADVNECAIYQGTAQGCHSGATCSNTNGGFSCGCPTGYTGVLCNVKSGTCSQGSNSDICGHGTCLNSAASHSCLCDDGWTKDTASPARCTIDIDECQQVNKPCHDSVQCINVPGTYFCGSCPTGFTGNGHQCNDINECLSANGGCSINPRVDCINTLGSRTCGPCPQGYEKTPSEACIWVGVCHTNNGGCSPNALCRDNPSLVTRSCQCNPGYTGTGEGPAGCTSINGTQPSNDPCSPNPCAHGNCFSPPNSNSFTCSCLQGWTGHQCQDDIDECANNICQNGGTCANLPGNYTCTCSQYNTGRNCETPTYACGGELTGQTGTFQFPPSIHDAYPHDVSCAWRITTVLHKILSVTFTRFQLERHVNCDYDFLQIHDGSTASAHKIGKYCGNDTIQGLQGKTINSTHNLLYFWFKADRSVNDRGFSFNWVTVTPECGLDIRNETSGVIRSPGYPGPYPVNRTCVWTIRVPAGNNIKLTFAQIDLEHHVNCSYDYLELRNGLLDSDRLLQRYCSNTNNPGTVVETEGNELYIKFHSDASATGNGFLFTWTADPTPVNSGCGGTLNLTDGILISPNFPNHYDHGGDCVWVITVPNSNARIALNFTDFQMESSSSCSFDYLEIHDGSDDTAPTFGKFCGNQIPAMITSTTHNLYLRFHSDTSVSGRGFRATWTVACGGTFTDQTGMLASPYWPDQYPHQKVCNYMLSAREDQVIEVTFSAFGVEASQADTSCTYDSLLAYDGSTADSTVLRRMCGSALPIPLISTGASMLLVFTSDGSVNDIGFRATYEFRNTTSVVDPSSCGGILTNASGTIVSPGHPNLYPHGAECLWEIRVAEGFQIRLSFNFFSIEHTTNCRYDYVQISNNRTSNSTLKFCGSSAPPTFTSTQNVLFVRFKADASIAHEGFSASYVSFNHSWCGDERRTLPGAITSPGYPGNYPHQRECIWTIAAPDNHQIAINITDLAIEEHIDCRYDYLEIRNGGNELSPLVDRYCGASTPTPNFVSQSNRLWIKFKSDVSDSARGFRIWYEDAGEGCGADLTGPSGMFLSPNYPASYSRSAECYWTITVAQGSSVMLIMVAMDIEHHPQCNYDYVEAIEGLHSGPTIAKVCGNVPPQPIRSQGNVMTVKFRSDTSLGGGGFHAAYHADCQNQNLTSWHGVIESPNFPLSYPNSRECSWIVRAPPGNILTYSFSHFDIEDHSNCVYDFLEVRDGSSPSSTLLHLYCGSELPLPYNSTGNTLRFRFKSDASLARNGFRLEYVTIGCGGDLNTPSGTFTSPNYPGQYPHNRECVWRITVPIGSQIKLQLSNVNIEFNSTCAYDYLEVLGGPDANSPVLSKICQNRNDSYIVTSSGNQMYVKFKTDESSSGSGFFANYTSIAGSGCGGVFTAPIGGIHSPGSPDNYPHNINCEWNITVAAFQTVQLTFKDLDLEAHDSCIFDYVVMYDGLENNAPEIDRICGTNLTDHTYTSSGRSMRVRMRTDGSSNGRGFTATYITSCGGRTIVGDEIGVIRSPNFPDNYDANHNCTWTLMGALAVDRITLQFTHMDLEESDSSLGLCTHDSVRVLQGDNTDAPEQGRYCGTGVPASITSTSYALTIIFTSDSSLQQTGFSASYSKSTSFCGGNITATHGAFSTPGYPDSYPRNSECIWILNAAPGNQMQLSFSSFELEDTDGCARDYVEVRDGTNINNVLGRYCGSTLPSNLTIAKSLHVKFRSDGNNNFAGFTAQFSTLTGGDLVGNTGQLASPLYPRPYPHNSDNRWTIIVDVGKKVRIEFVDLDIEVGAACSFDYVQFLDGAFDTGPAELLKTCGTTAPPPFSSTGNVMTVVFHTDISATGRGFLLGWTAVDQVITTPGTTVSPPTQPAGCNFNLVAADTAQNLTSPNWPNNYENRMSCTWIIRSTGGSKIQFIRQSMDIESSSTCIYDSLRIYDGLSERISNRLANMCGRSNVTETAVISSAGVMKLKFTTDSSVIGRGFFGIFKTACGGVLTGTSGVIKSPSHPNTYPTNSSCQWLITVAAGRTVELNVDSFNLPGSTNCTGDRLRILNGDNADSPHIEGNKWSYCGSQLPTLTAPYESGSRYMFVEFISDAQTDLGTTRRFQLTYTEKSVTCGGNLDIPDDDDFVGSITSPNFGNNNYPHNVDCAWVITAPANARIQLDFPHFDLEKHPDCDYDYLLIRDGGTENSRQLTKICGGDNQATIKSTSNVIRIRLVTDDSVGKGGFNITYRKENCGGTLIGAAGTIQSPQYPNDYPNNANCEWYIEAPVGHYIGLNFTRFALGNTQTTECAGEDTLSVYNRERFGNLTTMVGSYCGNRAPVDVRTADSKAYIRFTSNAATNFGGFSLSFFASVESCGGQLTTPTGVITSPNYPGYYAHSRECRWFITAPPGKRVAVTFVDFEIEHQPRCLYDYVEFTNGHLERSPKLGRYCGNNSVVGTVIESTGNKMLIHFNSDGSISNGGFRLTYSTSESITCGGVVTPSSGQVGQLLTPGYNETIQANGDIALSGLYPNNMQCEWNILGDTAVNSSIVLKFQPNRFKLEHDGECRYDFLLIREGVSAEGRDVGRFCSNLTNNVPTQIAVPGNQLWLAFVSDGSIQHEGFNISVQFAPCGGVLRGDSGTIVSPNYPGQYSHDMGCAWEIIADEGQQIELTINALDIEHNVKCEYDYVALYNGGSHQSPVIATLCDGATAVGKSYTAATNVMRIEFVSDFSQAGAGFNLTYRTKSQGCGGVFNSLTGNISTQNYPASYPNNIECVWDIMVPDGYHVKIQADGVFDIETGGSDTSSCFYDYVQFFTVSVAGEATEIDRKYCGNTAPPLQQSDGNHMRVKFRSDRWTTGVGFNLVWTAGCGGTFNANSGDMFSPGYPNNYERNLVCDYIIVADPNQYVVLQFNENNFRIESGSSCQYDSVSIFEGTVNGTSKGSFCGLTAPQPIATRGTMVVRFKTDNDTSDDGFRATFVKSDCGGHLNGTSGEFKSPTHPVDYHNNLNCTWQIEVSENLAVNLRFEEFELEASSNGNCRYDYLAVYDGPVVNESTLIGKYCGSLLPENVRSMSNILTAVFRTDSSVTKGGFRAIYTETHGAAQGCGGRRNDTSGVVTPVRDENGLYVSNLDCVWILTAPDDKVFSVQINGINIENGENGRCPYDGLELNDGFSSQDAKMLPNICGNTSNIQHVSATNIMRVRFYSDSSVNRVGFNLTYRAVNPTCGGVRTLTEASGSLNISSPGYPNAPTDIPSNCRWTIGAPVGKQIRLTITDLAITGDSGCATNYLQLRDQPFITNNGQGQNLQFCNTTTPYEFDSYGNELQVNFKYSTPSSSSGYRGFALNYAIASCNRTFTKMDGRVTSPGWPSSHPHNLNCMIRIEIPGPQYKIAVYFSQFSIEDHASCSYDYLEVFDGSNSTGKHCGNTIPGPFISTGNTMSFHLVTDPSVALGGFDFTYVVSPTGCGGTLTAPKGTFSSPTPGVINNCVWIIDLPSRLQPAIEFPVMDLRRNNTACPGAYVEVRNGGDAAAPLMGRFCDGATPSLSGSSNKLYIKFVAPGTLHSEAKFTAKYTSGEQSTVSVVRINPLVID